MRILDAALLAESRKTAYTPAKAVAIGPVDLSARFLGYDYRESIDRREITTLTFDNADRYFADVYRSSTPAVYTYLGQPVTLQRGVTIGKKTYLAPLPRLWVEGYRFTHSRSQSLFLVDCIDWRGKLDHIRPAADVTWTNTSAQTIVSYMLTQAGLTLMSGSMAAINVNFIFSVKETAHAALNRLMDSLPEFLYAGLNGEVKFVNLQIGVPPPTGPTHTFGWNPPSSSAAGAAHPVRPGTWFGFNLWRHNHFTIQGAGGLTDFEFDAAQNGLVGARRKNITDGALRTTGDLHTRAEVELLVQFWNSQKGQIYCLPVYGLELVDTAAMNMPNAGADAAKLVTHYRETNLPGKLEQIVTFGELPEKGSGQDTHDLIDGIAAPGTAEGRARTFIDAADGDYKIIFGDGTVKTIAAD